MNRAAVSPEPRDTHRAHGERPEARDETVRAQNLDAQVIVKLNQVIRGTAHYFATRWFTGRQVFRELDGWIRRRLRCMKYKRFSYHDNHRMRVKQLVRLGLLSLESFCPP